MKNGTDTCWFLLTVCNQSTSRKKLKNFLPWFSWENSGSSFRVPRRMIWFAICSISTTSSNIVWNILCASSESMQKTSGGFTEGFRLYQKLRRILCVSKIQRINIFGRGVYVDKNTAQAASVEFVRHRRTNYARRRLQKTGGKPRRGFSTC